MELTIRFAGKSLAEELPDMNIEVQDEEADSQ